MKVICDGLDLSDAVLKVSKALSIKSSNPILEGIKITAKQDKLTLIATDLELTIEKSIKADVLMEGETVVVGKYFVEFAKKLEKEQVELSKLSDGLLEIKYSDSESTLQVFNVENYPQINIEEEENSFIISKTEFKKIVERTVFACSSDDGRPILKGCLFEIEAGVLTAVALDGFRMAIVKKEVKASGDFKAIIPARTLLEITRLISDGEEEIKISVKKNSILVKLENTILISRLIEGEFVKYRHILPSSFSNTVTVNKQAFLTSIDRASIVTKNDKFNIVKLDIKEECMSVSAKSEVGNVNENVNINLIGKDIVIAFNSKYVMDFLKIAEHDFININLNSPIDPCLIKPVGEEGFNYLIIPLRINA